MNYFVHKTASGTGPQSGYQRKSVYRDSNTGVVWVLWATEKTIVEIQTDLSGELYIIGDSTDTTVLTVYPDLLAHKRAAIRAEGARRLVEVAGEYCPEERETWEQQRAEAEAYTADSNAIVPLLTAFAEGRGIPIEVLAAGILENATLFKTASGQVLGQTYALLDQVSAAPDLATALNVEWS